MKHIDRVTLWRRNKANEHKMLVIKSTFDGAWTVVDYNCDVMARKFSRGRAGWVEAIKYASDRARQRSIDRIVRRRWGMVGGDAA